jgi:hypothetical protein
LAILTEATELPASVNVLDGLYMAGFQVTLHGRFWVTPEGIGHLTCRCLP